MEEQSIVRPVSSSSTFSRSYNQTSSRSKIGLFSLVVLLSLLAGIYNWFTHLQQYLTQHPVKNWDHYQLTRVLQLSTQFSFQQAVLRYKFYLIFVCGYVEPNIVLAVAILLTFWVLLSIEKQTATPVAFYEYNGISIYLQLIRLGLDLFQYFITGRCYCLNSGAAAAWLNITTKYIYHRLPQLLNRPALLLGLLSVYVLSAVMIVVRSRIDLLIGVLVAVVELVWMGGGTVKFPRLVFQEKEEWAAAIGANDWYLWQPFRWNQYRDNDLMCVDNHQFYMTRDERIQGGQK